ncbi:MAG: UDP-N-acetyl-D-mannosaminuronic acid dehydrogenase [Candidatus Firestonebacteria bacterium RIFOXYC2_FULL_39_67]|nr:MAG: UDP-N-acetyl-D-mannosaminuronic acid dehydrogenase [Candidatus Firestonebacteria bacterium RIFOXYC2_FULL_39_67]OGF57309.1 MAG: UDP-N-acetyl-D-mannosaminuronic acid dehydrogenase [Candidatus Firestonebacteria bacterium RifOxyC12_full_39_7]
MKNSSVCVIGLGYIGLPTAALIASSGHNVLGVDINKKIISKIKTGKAHIDEPDLDSVVKRVVRSKALTVSIEPRFSDVFLIAVPTPFKRGNKPDLSFVEAAIDSILPYIRKGNTIILESTCPVGTTEKLIVLKLKEKGFDIDKDVYIAYCPERVLPGQILRELVSNDRIVGGINNISSGRIKEFYRTFVKGEVFTTNARTAELAKLAENSFRDVNIAFSNELSMICKHMNIDSSELIQLTNRHPRVKILNPGPGVGGHCIAVDPWFIVNSAPKQAKLIKMAREVNNSKVDWVVKDIIENITKYNKPIVGIFGLTYKQDVGDLRESPSLEIALKLKKMGYRIICSEPNRSEKEIKGLKILNIKDITKKANVLVFLVSHREYAKLGILNSKYKLVLKYVNI